LYKLSELYPEHRDRLVLSRYANIVNLPQTSIRVAKKQNIHSNANLTFLYPINDFPELEKHLTNKKDNTIIYSIIRQESEFESKAISYSGAIGLMQIMPSTGKMLAKQEKIRYSSKKLQIDPSYNVNLGSRYISDLIKEFNGSYILAISAYNAGPNRVKKWIKKNGDPRKENIDSIDWIEMIPYKETRSYVKKVLSNMQIYRMILDNEINDIRLINDLKKSTI
jgi:soluble lytic murein transglycosylase